jgi:cold shock CspA family protein
MSAGRADLGDVFYHRTAMLADQPMRRGDRVQFVLVHKRKGWRAERVERLTHVES